MNEWSERFFSGLWQEFQLHLWTDEDNRSAADKIERVLELQPGSKVLDVPCGDGRISLELAARDHQVTGVDITARFLAEARRNAGERGLSPLFQQSDMRELTFDAEFDAVINFGGSFGYFDEEDNNRVVEGVRRALRPGGRFLIDMPAMETILPQFRHRSWVEAGDVLVLIENRYDHDTGRIEGDWVLVGPDGSRESHHSSIRIYSFHELSGLLRAAGFETIQGLDAGSLEPFSVGASRLMLVATKG